MRHPFWILNTSLLVLLLVCAGFIFFTQQTLPKKLGSAKKSTATKPLSAFPTDTEAVDITKIYENDLFDTYHEKIMPPVEPDYTSPIPVPPTPTPVEIPEEAITPFLPPLQVTLKGIMILNDESQNVVIIEDNNTKKEENYKVGDSLEDAQLIRILHNRIILIRSNGQFETLYLSEKDVVNPTIENDQKDGWAQTARKISDVALEIDPTSFVEVVPTLAQFIDLFDITTVYKRGKSIGCRVGKISSGALPEVLGFEPNDIILSVAGISTTTTEARFEIYQHLLTLNIGDSFTVNCERGGQPFGFSITLKDLKDPLTFSSKQLQEEEKAVGILTGPSPEELEAERIQLLKDRYTFAQTAQDILVEQKEQMIEAVKSPLAQALDRSGDSGPQRGSSKDKVKNHSLSNES
jgi:type II secretion system protein C